MFPLLLACTLEEAVLPFALTFCLWLPLSTTAFRRGGERQEVDVLVMQDADDAVWKENPHARPEVIRRKEVC